MNSALIQEIIQESGMGVSFTRDGKYTAGITIALKGPVAAVPSLKNSKAPGTNYINEKTMSRIVAMDALWNAACRSYTGQDTAVVGFGDQPVHLLCIFGKRSRSFDLDNAMATVRDWLEPPWKTVGRGKQRNWGVGLVNNDSQITGYAVHASDIDLETTDTVISLRRLDDVRPLVAQFIAGVLI